MKTRRKLITTLLLLFLCTFALSAAGGEKEHGPTKLSTAASGLKKGEWVAFMGPPKGVGLWGISWQGTTAFRDANHRGFQLMGKGQGGIPATHVSYTKAL